jgi:hypothetical protein
MRVHKQPRPVSFCVELADSLFCFLKLALRAKSAQHSFKSGACFRLILSFVVQTCSMKSTTPALLLGVYTAFCIHISGAIPTVDESYPYTGPAVPIGDWIDPTINGNGEGFPRLVEPPAVVPLLSKPTNNINVIALSYIPQGINIHYQTPFGLGIAPSVKWGTSATALDSEATGSSHT